MSIEEIKKEIINRGYIGYEETLLSSLEKVEERFPCRHRKVDWDDSYGSCGACVIKEYADKYDDQLGVQVELEKEKEQSEYFRLEYNTLTDELAKEKERVAFWVESYDEELAHSKQAEVRIGQLENAIDEWTKLYHSLQEHADKLGKIISSQTDVRIEKEVELEFAEEKIRELDDRIEKLVLVIDEYAGRITKAEERVKDLERNRGAL